MQCFSPWRWGNFGQQLGEFWRGDIVGVGDAAAHDGDITYTWPAPSASHVSCHESWSRSVGKFSDTG